MKRRRPPATKSYSSDKFEGRLRAIGRSSAQVNASRSEFRGSIRVANEAVLKDIEPAFNRAFFDVDQSIRQDEGALRKLKKGKNDDASDEILMQGFAVLKSEDEEFKSFLVTGRRGRVITFRGTQSQVGKLEGGG